MMPARPPRWLVTAQRFGRLQRHIVYCGDDPRAAAEARVVMQQTLDRRHPDAWWLVSMYQIDNLP
jgi:hypothetical protein